jgi:hypothetical protein
MLKWAWRLPPSCDRFRAQPCFRPVSLHLVVAVSSRRGVGLAWSADWGHARGSRRAPGSSDIAMSIEPHRLTSPIIASMQAHVLPVVLIGRIARTRKNQIGRSAPRQIISRWRLPNVVARIWG